MTTNTDFSAFDFDELAHMGNEDTPLSSKISVSLCLERNAFSANRWVEEGIIRRAESAGQLCTNSSFTMASPMSSDSKIEFHERISLSPSHSQNETAASISEGESKGRKSILKCREKTKYYRQLKANNSLIPPFFRQGKQDPCENWDEKKWKEDQEWWGKQWDPVFTSVVELSLLREVASQFKTRSSRLYSC